MSGTEFDPGGVFSDQAKDTRNIIRELKAELATARAETAVVLEKAANAIKNWNFIACSDASGLANEIRALIPPDAAAALQERDATKDKRLTELEALLNTPEIEDFDKAVPLEAAHQILRWTAQHDEGKQPEDWFWLVGYLAGKALASFKAGNLDKAKHHCISTSAALRNWHAHIRSGQSAMRPGIAKPEDNHAAGN